MSEEEIRLQIEETVDEVIVEEEAPKKVVNKKRRGRIRYAAPLGFLVLLFAVRFTLFRVTEFLPSTTTPCDAVEVRSASFTVISAVE